MPREKQPWDRKTQLVWCSVAQRIQFPPCGFAIKTSCGALVHQILYPQILLIL